MPLLFLYSQQLTFIIDMTPLASNVNIDVLSL